MFSLKRLSTYVILFNVFIFPMCKILIFLLNSEQQPLRLNPAEVQDVIAAVCSESCLPNPNVLRLTRRLSNTSENPSMDVAVSVLIKLVIDMYVLMHLSIIFYCFLDCA